MSTSYINHLRKRQREASLSFLYQKLAEKKLLGNKELALKLLDWHGGQNDPIYAVGSSWLAGHEVLVSIIEDAIYNLKLERGEEPDELAGILEEMIRGREF